MVGVLYLSLMVAVFWDSRLLRQLDNKRFIGCFKGSGIYQVLIGATFVFYAGLFFYTGHDKFLIYFLSFIFLPLYFLRRRSFFKEGFAFANQEKSGRILIMADALGVFLGWFLSAIGVSVVLDLARESGLVNIGRLGELLLTTFVSSMAALFLIKRVSTRLDAGGFKQAVSLIKPCNVLRVPFFWAVVCGVVFGFISAQLIIGRSVQPVTPLNEIVADTDSSTAIAAFLCMALLVAPFIEEIMFRGYLYRVLSRFFNPGLALFLVAFTFGFMHMGQYWGDWPAITMIYIIGLALTFLRARSGSTLPSIVMHYTYNISVVIIAAVLFVRANPEYFEYKLHAHQISLDKQESLLLKSIERHPGFVEAHHDLALVYLQENKNFDEALLLVEKALDHEPGNKAYLQTRARIIEQAGLLTGSD